MIIERSINNAARVIKNEPAARALAMEERGATLAELLTVISGRLARQAYQEGDRDAGVISCGQVIGLIDTVPAVKEVMAEIIDGAHAIYRRLGAIGMHDRST